MELAYSKGLRNRKIIVRDIVSGSVGATDNFSFRKLWEGVKDVGRAVVNVSPIGSITKVATGKDLIAQKTELGKKYSAKTSTTRKIAGAAGIVIGGGIAAAPLVAPGVRKLITNVKTTAQAVDPNVKNMVMNKAGEIVGKVIKDNTPAGYGSPATDPASLPKTAPKKAIEEMNQNGVLDEFSFTNPLFIGGIVIVILLFVYMLKK